MTLSALFSSSKAKHNHLHQSLPYRFFDKATQLFHNQGTLGFGFELDVLGGANDETIEAINKITAGLPQGKHWHYQFTLTSNNHVAHLVEQNTALMSKRGGICQRLASDEQTYANYAATAGFLHRQKHHFSLREHRCFLFVSTNTDDADKMTDTKASIKTSLTQLGLTLTPMLERDLMTYVKERLNPDTTQIMPLVCSYNEFEPLNTQMISPDSEFIISRRHIDARSANENNQDTQSRMVNFGLLRLPNEARLYALPECFSSLKNVSLGIDCPFVCSVQFQIEELGGATANNDSHISALMKTVGSKMKILVPTAEQELKEREQLQQGLLSKEFNLASMVLTLTIYTNKNDSRAHAQSAIGAFAGGGIDIAPLNMLQGQALFSSLPFMASEGHWQDCQRAGRVRTMKTSNLVNFLPIIVDNKNYSGGMLLPTMRQQISFFDPFNCGSDNYNIALTGGSGAGKSFFVQLLAKSVYSKFGKVWILDKGASYKKLTLMLEGTYMTSKDIFLNPFTFLGKVKDKSECDEACKQDELNPLAEVLDNITALFSTMASPREELAPFQTAVLGDAILNAWHAKGTETRVDDVQAMLFLIAEKSENDKRISDIATQLNKYCSQGIYGDTFNKPSMLDPDIHITTLELDGFPEAVLRPAIFALMVSINQQMYLTGSRSTPKLCIIEEAWSLLSGANAQAREFINTGYRTARKFGGSFCTVTQGMLDFFANAEAQACYNNSDIHITLRQGEGFNNFIQSHPDTFTPYEQQIIKGFEKSSVAGYSCAMIKAGGHTSFHRLFTDPFTRACLSTEPNEFEYCETLMEGGTPLMSAIEKTAEHFYGDEMATFNALLKGGKKHDK